MLTAVITNGWAHPVGAKKAHLIDTAGRSLCGRWDHAGVTTPLSPDRDRPLIATRRECRGCCLTYNRAAFRLSKGIRT